MLCSKLMLSIDLYPRAAVLFVLVVVRDVDLELLEGPPFCGLDLNYDRPYLTSQLPTTKNDLILGIAICLTTRR